MIMCFIKVIEENVVILNCNVICNFLFRVVWIRFGEVVVEDGVYVIFVVY